MTEEEWERREFLMARFRRAWLEDRLADLPPPKESWWGSKFRGRDVEDVEVGWRL